MTRLIACGVAALALGPAAGQPRLTEAEAAAALEKLGARVTRDATLPGNPVVGVLCGKGCALADEHFTLFASLPEVRTLDLVGHARVTGTGLVHLRGLKKLEELDLSRCAIESRHLAPVKDFPELWKLGLWFTAVDDAGLKHLRDHPRLKNLYLTGAPVTDEGLRNLGSLPRLEDLRLGRTGITDEGLKLLTKARFPRLGGADVGGSKVTEAGCERIGRELGMRFDFYYTGVGSVPKKS